ncbi:MAG TPA: phosphoribosylamine--glycine ligase [bacterium]|nr:phosphoribosylamine--glycine ligase [bacterium]
MKILVVGGGGREHTLCWKLAQSDSVEKIYCAPGNAGIAGVAECVPIAADAIDDLARFASEKGIDLTVAGPELPLTLGLTDRFEEQGLKVFGPSRACAQLEGSKVFAKEFMKEFGIPTAGYEVFEKLEDAVAHLDKIDYPTVIKADGLAAGKGVLVAKTRDEADAFLKDIMLDRVFGEAGSCVIIEDCLQGEETSILALSDGKNMVVLTPSQDHKRALDDDMGPNTGGMGAYSPVSIVTPDLIDEIREKVLQRVVDGMNERGTPYVGVIYAGLMLTEKGPSVLEFNVRFGDPETQVVVPLIEGDLAEMFHAAVNGDVKTARWKPASRSALCVVMASGGYPGSYEKGKVIEGLEEAANMDDVIVFHAGTSEKDGEFVTGGGRVLGITGMGETLQEAQDKVYEAVKKIRWDNVQYRTDIGKRDLVRLK